MRKVFYISVPGNIKAEIQQQLGCARQTVHQALHYKSDGELACRIRQIALERGGQKTFQMKND